MLENEYKLYIWIQKKLGNVYIAAGPSSNIATILNKTICDILLQHSFVAFFAS
jgi:hypothetical protein